MNLTDIQTELRKIEESVISLHNQIENMKPKDADAVKKEFALIDRIASKYPLTNKAITNAPESIQRTYIQGLSYLLLNSQENIKNMLLYITRIAWGCGIEGGAEYVYKCSIDFSEEDLDNLVKDIKDYALSFLTDAMIISQLDMNDNKALSNVADIAKAFDLDDEIVRVSAKVAASFLCNDFDMLIGLEVSSPNRWAGCFSEYIPESWIKAQRVHVANICVCKYCDERENGLLAHISIEMKDEQYRQFYKCKVKDKINITFFANDKDVVKSNDIIATYKVKKHDPTLSQQSLSIWDIMNNNEKEEIETKEISSNAAGVVKLIYSNKNGESKLKQDEYLDIYVTSCFDSFND